MSGPIKIEVIGEFAKPSDEAVMGEKRLVRYLPVGLPGTQGMLLPCVWMSDYDILDKDLGERVRICLVLLSKGPPRPEIICVRIPSAAVDKFPTGPVEW